MSRYWVRQSSDTGWENSDEDDRLVNDEQVDLNTDINDETASVRRPKRIVKLYDRPIMSKMLTYSVTSWII